MFDGKVGVDLQFRNINAGSTKISITDDSANNEIDVDVVEANINHDALLNFVAAEHINHSTVAINAGVGLTGGGDITVTRTIDLDIDSLTVATPAAADTIAIYDDSAAAHRKITYSDIVNATAVENISGAAAAVFSPDEDVRTTFITTTSAGATATGTLADGNVDGMEKHFIATSLLADYTMTITNGIDATGTAISTLTFDSTGVSAFLIWDATTSNWFIANTGAIVAYNTSGPIV